MNLKKLAIGALMAAAAASAYAVNYYRHVLYYSDATYSTVVGEQITYCKSPGETFGTVTVYRRTIETYRCDRPIP